MRLLKRYALPLVSLVAVEQLIKLIIRVWFFEVNYSILPGLLAFHPKVNANLSWGGNYLPLLANPVVINLMNLLVIALLLSGYRFYCSRVTPPGKGAYALFLLGMAGSVCSLIDKLAWGGSLDYIQLPRLFTFDLKDCYLTAFMLPFLYLGMKYRKEISIKDYLNFCLRRRG